ncbi:MAG: hypothetical protein V2I56_23880 [Desulfobacteraceae bacterium]|jgi:hypothetical protein|nr:hypothetical protein [Desulfobacteraceae bacterium]
MAIEPVTAPNRILRAFEQLKKALIDTSSIIYSQKAGFFSTLSRTIQLYSIPEVISETEKQVPGVVLLQHCGSSSLSTDQKLISCALENNLAMISEDKSILTAMQRAEAPYYNSLMMLNLLLFSHRIDDESYRHYYRALEKFARYSEAVWEFGGDIYKAVKFKQHSETLL